MKADDIPSDISSDGMENDTKQEASQEEPVIDDGMKEVFKLSRDILKRLKLLAREAALDSEFKMEWIGALKKMKNNFDDQLKVFGAYEELSE